VELIAALEHRQDFAYGALPLGSGVQSRDRVFGERAVNFGQTFEVLTILRPAGETLEADDASQAGDRENETVVVRPHRLRRHRLEVQRRHASPDNVDHPGVGDDPEVLSAEQMLVQKWGLVPLTDRPERTQRSQYPAVVDRVVRDEDIDVLGGTDETIGDHGEAADHDEASPGVDQCPRGNVELRIARCAHCPCLLPA
jgi:hypothetical protein